jgi:chemotaxis protein methyltransferase CheR
VEGPAPRGGRPADFGQLAQRHADRGELAEALVCCERALALAKTDPALQFLRARILQELQRDDEALVALRNVLFLDPDHVSAHFTMANLHRRQGQVPAAAKHLANVRRLLANRDENEPLPQSGGLTVGRMNGFLAATERLAADSRNGEEGITHE